MTFAGPIRKHTALRWPARLNLIPWPATSPHRAAGWGRSPTAGPILEWAGR
jgi:hypothetical protein